MYQSRIGARSLYRQQESLRVKESISLAEKFPALKSLTVELAHFSPEGMTKNSQIKYTVNLQNAKAVFRFDCPNNECVQGDFDLSKELARAVSARRTTLTGEMSCSGWQSRTTIDSVHCHNLLRYTLSMTY